MLMLGCAFWLGARDVRGAEDVPLRPCLCFILWLTWVKGVSSDVDEIASSGPYMFDVTGRLRGLYVVFHDILLSWCCSAEFPPIFFFLAGSTNLHRGRSQSSCDQPRTRNPGGRISIGATR